MIDIHSDTLLALSEAARHLPNKPHVSTVWRWHLRGIRGIRLETILIGGKRYTSAEAIQLFLERTAAASSSNRLPTRTHSQRRKAREAASRELDNSGI